MYEITEWVAIIISLLALIFSGFELYISNKQFLFDKRLKIYHIYKLLLQHQKNVKPYFDEKENFHDDMAVSQLMNDSILYKSSMGWNDDGFILSGENHVNFLKNVEILHQYAEESYFFFEDINLKNYYDNYADLLMEIYKYRTARKNREKEKSEYGMFYQNDTYLQKELHDNITKLYNTLVNYSEQIDDNKLRKQIYLAKRFH